MTNLVSQFDHFNQEIKQQRSGSQIELKDRSSTIEPIKESELENVKSQKLLINNKEVPKPKVHKSSS